MRQNEDGRTVAAMDILVPKVGELVGGSQREERADKLEERIKEVNLNVDTYSWWVLSGGQPAVGIGLRALRLICSCCYIKWHSSSGIWTCVATAQCLMLDLASVLSDWCVQRTGLRKGD